MAQRFPRCPAVYTTPHQNMVETPHFFIFSSTTSINWRKHVIFQSRRRSSGLSATHLVTTENFGNILAQPLHGSISKPIFAFSILDRTEIDCIRTTISIPSRRHMQPQPWKAQRASGSITALSAKFHISSRARTEYQTMKSIFNS